MSRKERKKRSRRHARVERREERRLATEEQLAALPPGAPKPEKAPSAFAGVVPAIREKVEGAGYDIVEAKLHSNRRLVVMIDREEQGGIRLIDCERVSALVAAAIAETGHDAGGFAIEVESPGSDRPLTRPKDFIRYADRVVTLSLRRGREDGRRNFTGRLLGATEATISLQPLESEKAQTFDRRQVREVRLWPEVQKRELSKGARAKLREKALARGEGGAEGVPTRKPRHERRESVDTGGGARKRRREADDFGLSDALPPKRRRDEQA